MKEELFKKFDDAADRYIDLTKKNKGIDSYAAKEELDEAITEIEQNLDDDAVIGFMDEWTDWLESCRFKDHRLWQLMKEVRWELE